MSPLQAFAKDIWVADGPAVRFFGAAYPTRMIVVKLSEGSLWINSPVSATHDQAAQLEDIGPVAHLVSPTRLHDWRLALWEEFFPRARVWKAHTLGDTPPPAWKAEIDQVLFRGSIALAETEFFHKPSRTLIMGDFIQNFRFERNRPLLNTLKRLGGILEGGVPRDLRLSFIGKRRRRLGRDAVRELLAWDFDKLVVAHGDLVTNDARSLVRRAFHWL
jgi:hypothetical protein